ncbi:hypothetical protein [Asanoa siamensis]|uniref:Uncharacterized protein n=1 Tax=Asanoa siamensis TaxID=926357 RepID=A0ABQ4CS73_9ACTN|nr:hypothetical protein [Asanoa siamensis]GIF74127.1 hypothetical protein Asi02nite_36450 [Asanoa siamensis]
MTNTRQILVAFGAERPPALGNIWRITAKKTDFYIDPVREEDAFHLSVHGRNDVHRNGHRFQITAVRKNVNAARARGECIEHRLPRKGFAFDGEQLGPDVFRVARIRWLWDLQRHRFRETAAVPLPDLQDYQSARRLSWQLEPNEAIDIDFVVSYNEPYWPDGTNSLRDRARLEPLLNEAGMWLTATAYRRSQTMSPTPVGTVFPLPRNGDEATRITQGGHSDSGAGTIYWFVEGIAARQAVESLRSNLSVEPSV